MFSCKSLTSKGCTANFSLQYFNVNGTMSLFRTRLPSQYLTGFGFPNLLDMIGNTILFFFLGNAFQVEVLSDFCKVGAAGHSSALAGVDFCVSQPLFHFQGMGFPLIAFFFLADSMS